MKATLELRTAICRAWAALLLMTSLPVYGQDTRGLTWADVYGRDRISIRDPAPKDFQWLNDSTLLQFEEVWKQIDAVSGQARPFYNGEQLKKQLLAAGVTARDAQDFADGDWTLDNLTQRLCVLRRGQRLIRSGLDGDRVSIIDGLPESVELLTLSPAGNACAFVSDNDLWCADFETRQVRQLTRDGGETIRNGKADWIYYEEVLGRSRKAFQFSPDGQHLLFQQFDDSAVPVFMVVNHSKPAQFVEQEHYPRAGQQNPNVRLGVVSVNAGHFAWLSSPYQHASTLITGFGWYPDSSHVYWYAQNRSQTWLDFVSTSVHSNKSTVLFRETTKAWVESPGEPRFLSDGEFLLQSERSGWKHVDRFSADGKLRRALTSGNWDVTEIAAVNEPAGWIIVTGKKDSTIADDIYRVSLHDGTTRRLTKGGGHHVAQASPSGTLLLDRWSNHQLPVSVVIRDSDGQIRRTVHEGTRPEEFAELTLGDVSIQDVPLSDRQSTEAIVIRPPGFDPQRPYPIWLKVYGGPRYPRVRNSWRSRLNDHLLASLGVVVIQFDPQTAGGHGATGAWKAWKQLGVQETKDVEAVCEWLGEQSWVDASRIGLSGHSYGGYLTSYVMTHSDCIAAGIAGAPVTDWANYDTIYTERYMGTPQDNPAGYKRSSVVAAAADLHGQLLIIHGARDDNVHIANTFQLVHALQQASKPFELMVYPNARHAIHHQHFDRLKHDFVVRAFGLTMPAD